MGEVFANRTALVTGAASGIGRAVAQGFAAEGARVILLDVNREGLEETLATIGGDGAIVCTNLADPDGAARDAQEAIEAAGGVDYLCNVAGVTKDADQVLSADVAVWNTMVAINLVSPAMLIRVAAQSMIERGVSGRIVNVSSSSGFRAMAPPCYASTKAGIAGLTRSAAYELGKHDINVNAVAPGLTATPMATGRREFAIEDAVKSGPLANLVGRVSMPEDVASAILYLCRPESRQITGQVIHTSAGLVV